MELRSNKKYMSSCWTPLCFTLERRRGHDDDSGEDSGIQNVSYAVCVFLGKKQIFFSLSWYYYLKVYKNTWIL